MEKTVIIGGKKIKYTLIRKKVKNINLRIKQDGSVNVSAGNRVSCEYIEKFLVLHGDFILNALSRFEKKRTEFPLPRDYVDGELVSVLGRRVPLVVVKGRKNEASFQKEGLVLEVKDTFDTQLKRKTLDRFLREICKQTVTGLCYKVYPMFEGYDIKFPEIKYRQMVSRWGSCQSRDGILTFNYALVHAPIPCIEYVVMHEFTHFLHPDHSKAFYSRLTSFMPDWQTRKKALDMVPIRK